MRRRVCLAAAGLLASVVWSGCSLAGAGRVAEVDAGAAFTLRPGEAAGLRPAGPQVGFDGVTADSRCPRGERCIWAGDATVRVWIRPADGPRVPGELHTAPGAAQALRAAGHELRLLRLDPHPASGRPVVAADYRATFSLRPLSAGEAGESGEAGEAER